MATAPTRPDAVLIRRLRERDRTAWEELYVEYGPRLHGFAYRLTGNEHDAADLVQETFVRALPRLDSLDPETTQLGPYLFTTLRNLFLKSVERSKRVQPVDEVPEPVRVPAPIEDDPERSTLLSYQQQEVRAANALLSQRQRLVLALRELEERSYAEIGELVGLSENAVAQLVFRARESLRTELRLAQVDPERLPEPCRSHLPLLAAHLDGQLKGARKEEVLAHLEVCETCQASLESMEEAKRRYRTILLPLGAGEEVARAADHELELRGYWSQRAGSGVGRGGGRPVRRAVLIGVGVLALGAGGLGAAALLDRDERTVVAPVSATTVQTTQPATTPATPPSPTPPTTEPAGVTVTLGELPAARTKRTTTAPPETTQQVTTTSASATVSVPPPTARPTSPATKSATKPRPKVVAQPKATPTTPKTAQPVVIQQPTQPTTTAPPPDTTAPTVTISAAPPATTTMTGASFSFAASEGEVVFGCALDGAAFAGCTIPASYVSLGVGSHTFAVRATDAAGNTGPAAQHAWTINEALVLVLPDLVIVSLTKNGVIVRNVGNGTAAASILTVTLIGTFSIESLAPGQSTTRAWSICRTGTLTARADRSDVVTESNETNNVVSLASRCS